MVKLTTPMDEHYKRNRAAFFFRDMDACNKFKYKFADHWCNIKWNPPEEADDFPEAHDEYWLKHIDDDPVELADKNLQWGFSLLRYIGHDDLTSEQKKFVHELAEKF